MTGASTEHHRIRALRRDLDLAAERVGGELARARAAVRLDGALAASMPLLAAVPGLFLLAQLGAWIADAPAVGLSSILVALVAIALPLAWAWSQAAKVKRRGVSRAGALGAVDAHLGLEGRLLAAEEFLGLDMRGRFQEAAIEDAARRAHEAVRKGIDVAPERAELGAPASGWSAAGAALLVLASLIAGLERGPGPGAPDQIVAAAAGTGGAAETEPREDAAGDPQPDEPAPALPAAEQDARRDGDEAAESQDSPEITGDAKESAGKTGAGRSSGAMSASAASESKSAPSSQGKSSDPSKPPKKKPSAAKKPEDSGAEPEPQERQEDEQSGSTAGKGSSKGSNKNPTASDWKSRDQVTETDDQEIEDDEETDDDEEEQENRGGVQPSLRDRRPPVSRDLQIGFGNRPNPDANGRGGPSEQKKSRGVASLVLGVPIPDRIKGRPGPGPTKITQERIEPEAEDAAAVTAGARAPRSGELERPGALRLDPSLRAMVRDYFLAMRRTPSRQ